MGDLATAFLYSFEATFQVLGDERKEKRLLQLDDWLKQQPAYDLECRGLRTLRTREAHLRRAALSAGVDALVDTPFAGSTAGGRTPWHWTSVSVTEVGKKGQPGKMMPKLRAAELDDWADCCRRRHVLELMLHGVGRLRDLLVAVGP
jgi:hypothetical protein